MAEMTILQESHLYDNLALHLFLGM